MKKEYNELDEFIEDIHALSIRKEVVNLGLLTEDDFANNNFVSCIFHAEDDSPSLQIVDNFFKCYACGAKGDLIKFVQLYFNIDFMDAIKKLAEVYNVKIKNLRFNYDNKSSRLKREWENYLSDMENAPKEAKEMKRDFFPQEIGYDAKNKYVVLPLTSRTGSILGFTKRRVDKLHEIDGFSGKFKNPKWKHSSLKDSLMEHCHNIFNLYGASAEIRKINAVILSEGPKDVIAYQRINHPNVICCCGTGNSNNIWDMILPTGNIYLSMDNDEAGIKSTISTVLYLAPLYDIKHIFSIILPKGKDPYDIVIEQNGKEKLEEFYQNAVSSVEYFAKNASISEIKELYDIVPEYNKIFVLKCICKEKCMSVSEAESWINEGGLDGTSHRINQTLKDEANNNQMSEKDLLLAFVLGKDIESIPMMDIKKAKKILKLKYGINDAKLEELNI